MQRGIVFLKSQFSYVLLILLLLGSNFSYALNNPTATNDNAGNACNNTATTFTVTGNDFSNNTGGSIDLTSVDVNPTVTGIQTVYSVPGQGTFTSGTSNGTISFTPLSSFTGTSTIRYVVNDNFGLTSNVATATFTAIPAPVLTVTSPPSSCLSVDISLPSVTLGSSPGVLSYYNNLADAQLGVTPIISLTPLSISGTVYIRLQSLVNTCYAVGSVSAVINPIQNNVISTLSSVCSGSQPTISGTNPSGSNGIYAYLWESSTVSSTSGFSLGLGLNAGLNYTPPTISGTTWYRRTVLSSICNNVSAPFQINIDSPPTAATISGGNQQSLCGASVLPLLANLPAIGLGAWTQVSGPTSGSILGASLNSTSVVGLSNGVYVFRWTISSGACSANLANVTITNNALPPLTITSPVAVCSPNVANLTSASITSGSGTGTIGYFTNLLGTNSLSGANAISTTGTYFVKLTDANLCSTIKAVSVIVNSLPGLSINVPAPVCSPNKVDLTASAITLGSSLGLLDYYTNPAGTVSLTGANAVTASGVYYIKLTNLSNCSVILPVTVTVNALPVLTVVSPPAVCTPNTVNLTSSLVTSGSGLGLLSYYTDLGATVSLPGANAISTSGTYYIKLLDGNLCASVKAVNVTVNSLPILTVTSPAAVCSPNTVNLITPGVTLGSALGLLDYFADPSASISLTGANLISATGVYYIRLTNLNNCSIIQPVTVTVNALPILTITSPPAVCFPNVVDLTSPLITGGSSLGLFNYYTNISATTSLSGANAISTSGVYFIKLLNLNNCSIVQPVTVTINALPTLSVTNPPAVCSPNVVNLTASSLTAGSGAGALSYFLNSGGTISLTGANIVTATGTYYIKLTDANNCSSVQATSVVINPLPSASITFPGVSYCATGIANPIQTGVPGGIFSAITGLAINTVTGAINLANSAPGIYPVFYNFTNGTCANIAVTTITINALPLLTVTSPPAVCSPNTVDITLPSLTSGSDIGNIGFYTDLLGLTTLSGAVNIGTSGTYYVKLTNANLCSSIVPIAVTINPLPLANINYSGSLYCASGSIAPTQSGISGGNYIASAGLSLNTITGTINLGASDPGTYTVIYSFSNGICSNTTTTSVVIDALPVANISYGTGIFCATGSATPLLTGITGGTYSSTSGLVINTSTGIINLAASTAGTYTITYTFTNGTCTNTSTSLVTINALPLANISFTGASYCASGTITPIQLGVSGGNYSAGAGLSISSTTGAVNLSASNGGNYIVSYNFTVGGCSNTVNTSLTVNALPVLSITNPASVCSPSTVNLTSASVTSGSSAGTLDYYKDAGASTTLTGSAKVSVSGTYYIKLTDVNSCNTVQAVAVTINALPSAGISYAGTMHCAMSTIDPDQTGISGGAFSSAGGLTINASTGTINLGTSTAGNYTVTYNFSDGTCNNTATTTLTVSALPTATISYAGPYCATGTASPVQTGTSGGTYSSSFGISINPANGNINLGSSSAGTYTVTYGFSNGTCSNSVTTTVTVNTLPDASISYNGPFIASGTASPVQTGTTGGIYTSSASLSINSITGVVNLGASAPGDYTVTYTFTNGTCSNTVIAVLNISSSSAAVQYSSVPYCKVGTASPSQIGPSGGTYSASPAGIVINSTTGVINLSASIANTYMLTYTYLDGAVTTTTSTTININPLPTAVVSYGNTAYCASGTLTPTVSGTIGGNYTSTSGLVINPTSGVIDLDASTPGTYSIGYSLTNGTCDNLIITTVTINGVPTLSVTDPGPVCKPGTVDLTATAITTGSSAGTLRYYSNGSATTTLIGANAITASGTYFVMLTDANSCSSIQSVNATLNAQPAASITYGSASFCAVGTASPVQTGVTGGVYSGISTINATTGAIDLENTVGGTYTVNYNFNNGTCNNTATAIVTVNGLPVLSVTNPAAVCSPSSVDLTSAAIISGSSAGTLGYYRDASATNTFAGANDVNISGTYYLKLTNAQSCSVIEPVSITVNTKPVATLNYAGNVYCARGTVFPALTGTSGGSFTALTGLSINTTTGMVDLDASTAGNYTVNYNFSDGTCSNFTNTTLTVNALPILNITNPTPVCSPSSIDLTASAIIAGSSAGTKTYYTDAAEVNTLSGASVVTTSGTYYIKLTTANLCSETQPVSVTVNAQPKDNISYASSSYCTVGAISPVQAGMPGSAYTAGSGLSLNSLTGMIDLSASAAGNYTITYNFTDGTCSNMAITTLTVNALPVLSITSPAAICRPATITLTSPGITAGSSIGNRDYYNDALGTISLTGANVTASGTYYIKLTDANICSVIQPVAVTLYPQPILNITDPAPVCQPLMIDLTEGLITAGSDPGVLNYYSDSLATTTLSGVANITTSGASYIKLTNTNSCSSIRQVNVTINAQANANISYGNNPYCGLSTVLPTVTGVTGGTYSSASGLFINTSTGEVNLGSSLEGNYIVTYSFSNGCSNTTTDVVSVIGMPVLSVTNPAKICLPAVLDLTSPSITTGSSSGIFEYYSDAAGTLALSSATSITGSSTYYIKLTKLGLCSVIKPVTTDVEWCLSSMDINPDSDVIVENTIANICVLCNDTSRAGRSFNFSTLSIVTDLPDGTGTLEVSTITGWIKYTPALNFKGIVSFRYRICDTGVPPLCGEEIVTITVIPGAMNAAPVAVPDSIIGDNGIPVKLLIVGNDYDTDGTLDLSSIDLDPATDGIQKIFEVEGKGTFTVDNTGIVTFTPVLTFSGTISIEYVISDDKGLVSNKASISITIRPPAEHPLMGNVPDAFSPNGDGNNDKYFIRKPVDSPRISLAVFNRWGNVVYENDDYENEWEGKPNRGIIVSSGDGKVPNGTYFVMVNFNNGEKAVLRSLTILR